MDGADMKATQLAELLACECRVWDALVSGDQQADAAALADAFLGVYPDGFAGKADHLRQLENGPTLRRYDLTKARAMPLGSAHAVLSYRADFVRLGHSEAEAMPEAMPEAMYVSSIWQRKKPGWVNIFSQDTPAKD
jgi:hypothetical protein